MTNVDAIAVAWAPRVLSILRIMAGLLLLAHGTAKILKFPVVPNLANLDLSSLPGIAGFLELIGGALLVIGLFTRPRRAAFTRALTTASLQRSIASSSSISRRPVRARGASTPRAASSP